MKVDFYTYNQPTIKYQAPTFKARPINVDWNSKSGKKIEQILAWIGATAMAGITEYKNDKETTGLSDEEKEVYEEFIDFDEETALAQSKAMLEKYYKKTKDEKIIDKHWKLFLDAYENRALLRGGYSELDDYTLAYSFMDSRVVSTLNLLGKGVLEQAFSLDIQGFNNFCHNIFVMQQNISNQNLELLEKKINPESSNEYINLNEEIKKDKRKISQLLGKENSAKRKELLEQIELLKSDKTKTKEIKELKSQIQSLYKTCENAEQISALMKGINKKQSKKKELVNQKVKLSPQEIINKVWTIASISASPHYDTNKVTLPIYSQEQLQQLAAIGEPTEDGKYLIEADNAFDFLGEDLQYYMGKNKRKLNKDIKELIDLIQPSTLENDRAWKDIINKKLYEYANIRYNPKYTDKIDLANCKYLNELIISDSDFWAYMTEFLTAVATYLYSNPHGSVDDAIDSFEHNIQTKEDFTRNEIDYYRWTRYNQDSFVEASVVIKADDAKQKAVKNLCDDLTSKTFKKIPLKVRKSLYNALSEIGVTVDKNKVQIDGRDVKFEDLDTIMSVIKTELSSNEFWSYESDDENVDKARDTIYCHFMLQRKQEIDCAKGLKESETVDVKVQKVDMSDIKHSLCLGNHSHCCTALGSQSNEWSAPNYITNRCISAIEILANGESIGNTMIYPAIIEHDNKCYFTLVLDDIELQTKFQNNEKIKNMIIEYAKKLCKEVGLDDGPIYAGPGMHKVDMSAYPLVKAEMSIIGKSAEGFGIYLDFDGQQHDIGNIIEVTNLYEIA